MVFEALANKHRRKIVYMLGFQPYSISQLAATRQLSLPAIYKHIKILERADAVHRNRLGRTTFLTLNQTALFTLESWLSQYHAYWGTNTEILENYSTLLKGGDR